MKAIKIKFEVEKPYNPECVAKIQRSRKQAMEGKTVKIDLDDIWDKLHLLSRGRFSLLEKLLFIQSKSSI